MNATEHDEGTTHDTTIHRVSAAILVAALLAAPAAAEQVTLAAPIQAGSLYDGPLDMVLYYLPVAGGLLEVTGTCVPKEGGAARRFVMGLSEGDAVSFAMPGYPQAELPLRAGGQDGHRRGRGLRTSPPRGRPAMIELVFVACLATATDTTPSAACFACPRPD